MNSDNPSLVLFAICAAPVALSLVITTIRCWLRRNPEEARERFSIFTIGLLAAIVCALLQPCIPLAAYVLEPLHRAAPDSISYLFGGVMWQITCFLWFIATAATALTYLVCMCWCSLGDDDSVCGMAI